jgi:DNA-binding NarL/FixJ family response regulator
VGSPNRHDLDPLKGLALPSNRLRLLPNPSDGEVIDLIEPPEPTTTFSTRVLLVDDNDLFRAGLRTLLEEEKVDVVGEARTGADALVEIGNVAPDVVVMDLNMPGMSGVEAIRQMAAIAPRTRVLVLTASHEDADVMDAIMSGACGYLVKDSSIHDLLTGIRAAANGESLISPAIASKVLHHLRIGTSPPEEPTPSGLTDREMQVLRLIANGQDNAQIAAELHISPKTVKNHISNILMKLQIENRIQAAVFAVRSGLA